MIALLTYIEATGIMPAASLSDRLLLVLTTICFGRLPPHFYLFFFTLWTCSDQPCCYISPMTASGSSSRVSSYFPRMVVWIRSLVPELIG